MTRKRLAAEQVMCCRLNFFPQRWLHIPKLDIEIFYFFGKINLYANLNPRANLVSPRAIRWSSIMHPCTSPWA